MKKELKYHIITMGCQMNKSDSERVRSLLERLGFFETDNREEADFILINTCSVRQTAEDRVYGLMKEFARLKKNNARLITAVTGCMAGRDKDNKMRKKLSEVDLFFPIDDLPNLPKWISELNPEVELISNIESDYLGLSAKFSSNFQAFVPIQTGCNQFCTYCVVPYARGRERYRPVREVMSEIIELDRKGYKEITLLGQAVNSYEPIDAQEFSNNNPYKDNFAALLWEINQLENIARVHFTAPHPLHINDEQIDVLALPKQVNYLHLPVQSGDNEVLARMNRKYTREYYLDIINKIRERVPDIVLGTDIIVGFCGETEKQFQNTVDLYKQADFDISYTAMYSPRSGTVAAKNFPDDVLLTEKKRRWWELQKIMEKNTLRKNKKFLNKEVEVLVENYKKGYCQGNSREMKTVRFKNNQDLNGEIVKVKIDKPEMWILEGNLK